MNLDIVKSYIKRNPSLSDEDISIRLGVSIKKVSKAKKEIEEPIKNSSDKVLANTYKNPDVVDNPIDSLKNKLRQLDQTFEIARKEFLIDPSADNAMNMATMLREIKDTLKVMDSFTDLGAISDNIINNVMIVLVKNLMDSCYTQVTKFVDEFGEYLPKAIRAQVNEYPKSFMSSLGKDTKEIYDKSLHELENIVKVPLDKYYTKEQITKKKKGK